MTCHSHNPCRPRPACPAIVGEPIGSQLQNFIAAFYGDVQVVQNADGSYSWVLPCDLEQGIPDWPATVGTACLFSDILNNLLTQALTMNQAALTNGRLYFVIRNIPFAGRIESASWKLLSGTATFDVQIDGVDVTGLAALAASSTQATANGTALNTFTVGQDINIQINAASSPVDFDITLKIRRTPA